MKRTVLLIFFTVLAITPLSAQQPIELPKSQPEQRRPSVNPVKVRAIRTLLDKVIVLYKLEDLALDLVFIGEKIVAPIVLNVEENHPIRKNDAKHQKQMQAVRQYGPRLIEEVKAIIEANRNPFLNDLAYALAADLQDNELEAAETLLLSEGMVRQAEAVRTIIKALMTVQSSDFAQAREFFISAKAESMFSSVAASQRIQNAGTRWGIVIVSSLSPEIRDALEIPDDLGATPRNR